MRVKPGKPLVFGEVDGGKGPVPLLGLPGNPVSAAITYLLFAKPFIETLLGRTYREPIPVAVPARFDAPDPGSRPTYIRVTLQTEGLARDPAQGSHQMAALARADGLALLAADCRVQQGDLLPYWPMRILTDLV